MEAKRITLLFALRIALSAALLWTVLHYLSTIPAILAIPIAGVLLAKPVLEAAESYIGWAKKQPYAKWHGNYYEFAGTQIRLIELGREFWVVDADLLRVIGEKSSLMLENRFSTDEYTSIADGKYRGFSPAGTEKVLSESHHIEAKRMLMWLQREVYKPHRRKQELATWH